MGIKDTLKYTRLGAMISAHRTNQRRIEIADRQIERIRQYFSTYSATAIGKAYYRLRIAVNSHVIEKGLSHNDLRPGFGKKQIVELQQSLDAYPTIQNDDPFVYANAVALLGKYHQINEAMGFDDGDFVNLKYCQSGELLGIGVKEYDYDQVIKTIDSSQFAAFARSRSSVRVFDYKCKEIEDSVFYECIELAQTAPSACNRQSTRVHILKDESRYVDIERLQLGCKGFGRNASAFLFITADMSLYECAEVMLPIYDAGLFAMNLIYALHEKKIFACALNAAFPGETEPEVKRIVGIPENEMIVGLIAAYNVDTSRPVKVPVSMRRDPREICSFSGGEKP